MLTPDQGSIEQGGIGKSWQPFRTAIVFLVSALCLAACDRSPATPALTEIVVPPSPVVEIAASPTFQEISTPSPVASIPTPARPDPTTVDPTLPPQATPPSVIGDCKPDLCTYAAPLFLHRPIAPPGNDAFDLTYRFGTTQGKVRDPHHGVEFLNAYGTPVLAAADGLVVTAGGDLEPTSPHGAWPITFYGPYMNFYGNLVVIEHQLPEALKTALPDLLDPIYTLYGHLSEIDVQVGQAVTAGQQIGKVGQAGIATGPHLHFEVRLGENTYAASRNPELWLVPSFLAGGQPMGALAGRFIDTYGNSQEKDSIVLQHLPDGPGGAAGFEVTLMTYEEKKLIGQLPWQESFGATDLPPGWYRVSFPMNGLRQELVQIFPGALTVITFR